jgi:hypothetical protein
MHPSDREEVKALAARLYTLRLASADADALWGDEALEKLAAATLNAASVFFDTAEDVLDEAEEREENE